MDISPIVLSIPIFFILIGLELIVQHFSKRKLYRVNDAITNLSCGITSQITGVFIKIVTIALYQFIYENFSLLVIPTNWWTITILFMSADMLYYWGHRMSHQINLFWGSHVVHHQSEDYNLSVALRQSSFQTIWTFGFYLPLAFIGFETMTFVLITVFITLYQFWIHTETIGKLGWIEYVLNTPSHHRVHHGRDPKYIDKNHAGTFIIWDKMFGTYQEEEETPTYGITKPVNSWNPIWANFDYYSILFKQILGTPGLMNKLGILFNKPGWRPKSLGGYQPAPSVDKLTYTKYNEHPSFKVNIYVLFQFLITLIVASYFLFQQNSFNITQKSLFAILIVSYVLNCGGLLERKSWVLPSEWVKYLILIWLSYLIYGFSTITIGSFLYSFISITWLYYIKSEVDHNTQIDVAKS